MITHIPEHIFWGMDKGALLPISNLPPGAVVIKRKLRAKLAARAFVRVGTTTTCYYLGPDGKGGAKLLWPIAINVAGPHVNNSANPKG